MKEFKFACPVCGQHLTAAPGDSGATIECPTCFRSIIVPQAANPDSKLVMTASEAGKPRALGGTVSAGVASSAPRPGLAYAVGFLLVGAVCALGFTFFGERLWHNTSGEVKLSEERFQEKLRNPTAPAWSRDPAAAQLVWRPAAGAVHGASFIAERVLLRGTNLVFRQGAGPQPELALAVSLPWVPTNTFQIRVAPSDKPPLPQIVVRWKDERGQMASQVHKEGYLLNIAMDAPTTNRVQGRIYVAVPDEAQSYVAGSFSAEILTPPVNRRGRSSAVR